LFRKHSPGSSGQIKGWQLSCGESPKAGIIQTINDDLSVLYFLAGLLETYVEETRPYNPLQIVDEYFKL